MPDLIPVLSAPLFEPELNRIEVEVPEGLTLLQIVRRVMPRVTDEELAGLRIILVTSQGALPVEQCWWRATRPRPGVRVVIRPVPGKNALGAVLSVVITVAAIALGQVWGAALAGSLGISTTAAAGLITAGLTMVGNLLLRALIPTPKPKSNNGAATYQINGWQNQARPDDPVPFVCGKFRYAPPFAATSYSEIVGDQQYIRAFFAPGYGPLSITDCRIGDTSIAEYDDIEIEIREGREGDDPITLYPQQVVEESVGVDLTRPKPRDDAGNVISGDAKETPVTRFTGFDAQRASVIIAFPSGLFKVDDKGKKKSQNVKVRIRQRAEDQDDWQDVETLTLSASKQETFFRQFTWALPSRGRWEVEVTRMTDERTSTNTSDRTVFAALQTLRPEYPLNFPKPLALIAVRIRATYQLNGTLGNFNCLLQRYGQVWDGTSWSEGLTRNPASAFITAMTGPMNTFPVTTDALDMALLADWFTWCESKNLKYDAAHDSSDDSMGDVLKVIAGAGRAAPRYDGIRYGVVIDRPQELVVDHISPRNSSQFSGQRTYFDPPHAMRVTFFDETNDYAQAVRIIRWPGYTGDITVVEDLDLPGKTDPDEIWIEARRRMYELLYRPDSFQVTQDGVARVATRGDLVMASLDVLSRTQRATRVRAVSGALVELDETVIMVAGKTYAIRFRVFADEEDTIGTSVVREVVTVPGATRLLRMKLTDQKPTVGFLTHFGEMGSESFAMRVKGIEAGEDLASIVHMVADAPEIDQLTDAEIPPAWNGRVGEEVDLPPSVTTPEPPVFTAVASGLTGTDSSDGLLVELAPGAGSSAVVASFRLEYKHHSDSTWSSLTFPAADGGASVPGFFFLQQVDLRAVAISDTGIESAYNTTVTLFVGFQDAGLPSALDSTSISVVGGLGSSTITAAIGGDANTKQLQIYRVPAGGTLDRTAHALGDPSAVKTASTFSFVDGDGTRETLLADGGFDTAGAWMADASWTIGGGVATHAAGVADQIAQGVSLTSGKYYRAAFTIAVRTAGSLTPALLGGSAHTGAVASADGIAFARIAATSGNTSFALLASDTFDGSVDDVLLFEETAACVEAGSYDYYLEPQNADGVGGPMSGPFTVNIT